MSTPSYLFDTAFVSPQGYPDANGINLLDQVVGDNTADGEYFEGWIERVQGTPVDVTVANAISVALFAVNDSGVAVGTWGDVDEHPHAFYLPANGKPVDLGQALEYPEQSWGMDINNRGLVVGSVQVGGTELDPITRGFVYSIELETLMLLDPFPGYLSSWASAVNNHGQVVGTCFNDTDQKPFVANAGKLTDFSGRNDLTAADINDQGLITGSQGFLASNESGSGMFTWSKGPLTEIALNGMPSAINTHGQIVGCAMHQGGGTYAFIYENGRAYDLNSITRLPSGLAGKLINARDINDNGHIAVSALTPDYLLGFDALLIPGPPVPDLLAPQQPPSRTRMFGRQPDETSFSVAQRLLRR